MNYFLPILPQKVNSNVSNFLSKMQITNLILFLVSIVTCSNVVVLTPKNIKKVIDGSKNVLVKFYAPW